MNEQQAEDQPWSSTVDSQLPVAPQTAEKSQWESRKRSALSWAIRIILVGLLWLPQPFLFLKELLAGNESYGFLGGWNYFLVAILLVLLTVFILSAKPKHKPTVALGCACAALAALFAGNALYANSLFVDKGSYDAKTAQRMSEDTLEANLAEGYEQYRPFTSDKIARLDMPSTLTFVTGDKLPRVDCATALLPLASSLVTATYPQEATTVGWEAGSYAEAFVNAYYDGYCNGYSAKCNGDKPDSQAPSGYNQAGFDAGYSDGYAEGVLGSNEMKAHYSTIRAKAMELLTDEDKAQEPNFQYNNSSEGFTKLADNMTDVFFGTKADTEQLEYAKKHGVEFEYTPVGREGFVFLVNADNPVSSLTLEQVKGIYAGKIRNWKEVGGNDEPIDAYQRNANSGSQSMMERFMDGTPLMTAPSTLVSQSMGGMVKRIADYDNGHGAIGYSFRYYVTDLVGNYDVKLLAIEGVEPTIENIEDSSYPITGEFYAVTRKGDKDENLARLLKWVRGEQGQELVEKSGYARLK